MLELTECPNCGAKLQPGFFTVNELLSEDACRIINEYSGNSSQNYCQKCGAEIMGRFLTRVIEERGSLSRKIQSLIGEMPIISIQSPLNWDYQVLGMVTSQSTTGTGIITEMVSSFTDLFGAQSERHNAKLQAGESICFAQLRKKTLDIGGSAVIATDIDYSEVGGEKGMLMLCASGTAVKLKNLDVLGSERSSLMKELLDANQRLTALNMIEKPKV